MTDGVKCSLLLFKSPDLRRDVLTLYAVSIIGIMRDSCLFFVFWAIIFFQVCTPTRTTSGWISEWWTTVRLGNPCIAHHSSGREHLSSLCRLHIHVKTCKKMKSALENRIATMKFLHLTHCQRNRRSTWQRYTSSVPASVHVLLGLRHSSISSKSASLTVNRLRWRNSNISMYNASMLSKICCATLRSVLNWSCVVPAQYFKISYKGALNSPVSIAVLVLGS